MERVPVVIAVPFCESGSGGRDNADCTCAGTNSCVPHVCIFQLLVSWLFYLYQLYLLGFNDFVDASETSRCTDRDCVVRMSRLDVPFVYLSCQLYRNAHLCAAKQHHNTVNFASIEGHHETYR